MAHENGTNEELDALIRRTTEAARAYIRGDMRAYFALIRHGEAYTLMAPFGGEPTRAASRTPRPSASRPWGATSEAARRRWRSCGRTRPATWRCWW